MLSSTVTKAVEDVLGSLPPRWHEPPQLPWAVRGNEQHPNPAAAAPTGWWETSKSVQGRMDPPSHPQRRADLFPGCGNASETS